MNHRARPPSPHFGENKNPPLASDNIDLETGGLIITFYNLVSGAHHVLACQNFAEPAPLRSTPSTAEATSTHRSPYISNVIGRAADRSRTVQTAYRDGLYRECALRASRAGRDTHRSFWQPRQYCEARA